MTVETCWNCDGTGRVPPFDETCVICEGTGQFDYRAVEDVPTGWRL